MTIDDIFTNWLATVGTDFIQLLWVLLVMLFFLYPLMCHWLMRHDKLQSKTD